MFFNSWASLGKVLVAGILAYVALVFFLRISGKRTLAQMNAFDFIVTVAFGSTLASVLLSKSVALLEGLLAFALLISLQFLVAQLSMRSSFFNHLIKSEPRLLFHQGAFLEGAMKKERIREEELLQAIREQGMVSLEQVQAVVLETNGRFSIIRKSKDQSESTLANVDGRKMER